MRKIIFIIVFFIFFSALLFGKDKFFVSAGAAAVFPADKRFKDFYGSVQFSPELKAGYNFFESFYLWLGYSFFSASYTFRFYLMKPVSTSISWLSESVGKPAAAVACNPIFLPR